MLGFPASFLRFSSSTCQDSWDDHNAWRFSFACASTPGLLYLLLRFASASRRQKGLWEGAQGQCAELFETLSHGSEDFAFARSLVTVFYLLTAADPRRGVHPEGRTVIRN